MKSIILSIGLVFLLALSFGCDSDNNVAAQDEEPGPTAPEQMTTVNGSIIDPGEQCSGMLDGFEVGDSVTVQLVQGSPQEMMPFGKVDNNTKGTSVNCNLNGVITDELPFSAMVCDSENSTIAGFTNGDFMSILISFTWKDVFLENLSKNVTIIAEDIGVMTNTKNVPCAMAKIDSLTTSN